jgi:hypothetical protein
MNSQDNEVRPYKLFNQLIADTVVVTMDPGRPEVVNSTNEAGRLAGFRIRTLNLLPPPQQVLVRGEAAFHMNLNRDRIQAVFAEVGRSDIHVPDSLDGATIAVHIPKAAVSMYGDCRGRIEVRHESTGNFAVESKRTKPGTEDFGSNCTLLLQAPAPTVSVPAGLDMAAIAEAGLELTGMSSSEAHSLCQTIDWSSTLVVPVPRDISSVQPVKVDGVDGTLVEIPSHANAYVLLWVKDGVIFSLSGHGGTQDALAAAASLR